MKKFILLLTFVFFVVFNGFAQVNPIQNLQYNQYYNFGNYFRLSWDEPATPHDNLIGYNVYRENELYQFQTETYVTNIPDEFSDPPYGVNGEDFLSYQEGVFYAHVTAVYAVDDNRVESIYNDSIHTEGQSIYVKPHLKKRIVVYPNPTNGKIYISGENLKTIIVRNMQGKRVAVKIATSQLDLSGKSKGVYFLQLISEDNRKVVKRIILR